MPAITDFTTKMPIVIDFAHVSKKKGGGGNL